MTDITVQVSQPGSPSTWGLSTWDNGAWGQFTGVSSSSGSVTVDAEISTGWGGDQWNVNAWGDLATTYIVLSGQSMTTAMGTMDYIGSETGWGRRGWNELAWGIGGTLLANSFNLTTSIGNVTATGIVNQGWGGDTWGENLWGNLVPTVPVAVGQQLTMSMGELAYAQASDGWGRLEWGEEAWGISGDVLLGQLPMTSSLGTVSITAEINKGWGANSYGNGAWGVHYSAAPTGQVLTSSIGNENSFTDIDITQTTAGLLNFAAIGTFSIQIDSDVSVVQAGENTMNLSLGTFALEQDTEESVSGQSLTTSVGNAVGGTLMEVPVTGIASTLSLGNITLIQSTNESVSGQSVTLSLGDEGPIPQVMVGVSGQSLTSSIGTISSVTGTANIQLTGIGLTTSTGTPNIISWQEIDLGVNNVWTEVDLAA